MHETAGMRCLPIESVSMGILAILKTGRLEIETEAKMEVKGV